MMPKNKENDLLPEKHYFTIGEVSRICKIKPHVLRYWEQEFPNLKPCKRRGNRRYYLYKDVLMVRLIKNLLYEQGFTIGGARQKLACEEGINMSLVDELEVNKKKSASSNKMTQDILIELQEVADLLA